MKALTHTVLIVVLSVPFAVSAQTAPSDMPETPQPGETEKTTDAPKTGTSKEAKLTDEELQIIADFHGDNRMDVELGKLAMKRGTTQEVKSFGETLVKEHGEFDQQLMALAKKTDQTIPAEKPESDAEKQALVNAKQTAAKLKKLEGASFDREFLRFVVEDHDRALARIDSQIAETKNTELAGLLRDAKPTLQRHHDQARELHGKAQAMQ
jgi:putative membrane protein